MSDVVPSPTETAPGRTDPGEDAGSDPDGLSFHSASVGEALAQLAAQRLTGRLVIGDRAEVWLDEGRTYLAAAPDSPALFEVVLAAGVCGPATLEAHFAAATEGGSPVCDRLVEIEGEADARLRSLLHEHVMGALFELAVPETRTLRFDAGVRHPLGSRFAEATTPLLEATERRLELWRRIAERIPTTSARFEVARSLPGGGERLVTADEWTVLALLDGQRTVVDVITETGDSALRVCAVLYRMLLEGLVQPAERA